MFEDLINEATDIIVSELGSQVIDGDAQENIRQKVIQIINSGITTINEIVQTFFDESNEVPYNSTL